MALPMLAVLASCRIAVSPSSAPVGFDTATAWIHHDSDSTALWVEIARTEAQQELGLSGRSFLDADSGMLFQFDRVRSGDEGFWMVGVDVPLDIAFLDESGVILRILTMDLCQSPGTRASCPGYFPGVEYASALEANRGWFETNGIDVGARVVVVP
ncbi:MAG: DUF192 domain-containing protein [Gammaproteobacteria bacterium]|nr:DUF192 domain-containing protein [Gammaproteobacteria bacterium]MDE0248821.1 DUF192 domain-containing protein [Gammaproteobacteria bacterium]